MKIKTAFASALAGGAFLISTPALADDWRLKCEYTSGLEIFVSYDAGGPAYDIYISSSGSSDLGRGQRFQLNKLSSPQETILFTRADGDVQFIFRVFDESLSSTIEIGSQASWDYQKFDGRCEVLEQ